MILSFHQLGKEVKEMEAHEDFNLEAMTVNVDAANTEEAYTIQSRSSASTTFWVWTLTLAIRTGSGVVPYTTG